VPRSYIGLFGALIFTGAALGCFFMPALGDKYGRWLLFQVTMVIQIPLFVCCLLANSLAMIYFVCFYLGIALIGRFTNGYLLLTELVPEKYEPWVGPALLSGDSAMILYLTFYYRYISKNSVPLLYIGLGLNIFCLVVTMVWIPESVRWLVSVKQYVKAREALAKIARFNGVDLSD
jgi:MFS family permease